MGRYRKGTIKDWLIVLASLLDDAAVVLLVLLLFWLLKIPISLSVIALLVVLFIALVLIMHRAVIPSLHRKKVTGAEGMVGLEGRVVEALAPVGVVRVKGEYWKAKSTGEVIAVGEEVEILKADGLTLEVRRKVR